MFCDSQIEGTPKSARSIEFHLCCNSLSSEKTMFNYLIYVSTRNFVNIPEYSIKKLWLCAFIIILIVRKVLLLMISLDIQLFSQQLQVWFRPSVSEAENFTAVEEDLIRKPFVSIHVSNSWPFGFSKKSDSDSSRFSNCSFSEIIALISSIMASIESVAFVEKHSIWRSLTLIFALKS